MKYPKYKYYFECPKCNNPAFYIKKIPGIGDEFPVNNYLLINGKKPIAGQTMKCGACANERLSEQKNINWFILNLERVIKRQDCPGCDDGEISFIINLDIREQEERLPRCASCYSAFKAESLGWSLLHK